MNYLVNIVVSAAGGAMIANGFVFVGLMLLVAGFGLGVALDRKQKPDEYDSY